MIHLRRDEDRGHVQQDWLDSKHTFSFGGYQDERFMGFRDLRVINEDIVAQSDGFDTHPHKSMEILTYMLDGAIKHTDSMGNAEVIRPGDVQYLSAGTGISHSEMNDSKTEKAHLLQIWIIPSTQGGTPNYGQKSFPIEGRTNQLKLIAGPASDPATASLDAIPIRQDAKIFASVLKSETTGTLSAALKYNLKTDRHYWVQNAKGSLEVTVSMKGTVNTEMLRPGDALAITEGSELSFRTHEFAEFLLFDLR
jgi:redox-sensitive bicupin YhaK (pirin superfamily)